MAEPVVTDWVYTRDVMLDLDCTRPTAIERLQRIPGVERITGGRRWRAPKAAYEAWKAAERANAA